MAVVVGFAGAPIGFGLPVEAEDLPRGSGHKVPIFSLRESGVCTIPGATEFAVAEVVFGAPQADGAGWVLGSCADPKTRTLLAKRCLAGRRGC